MTTREEPRWTQEEADTRVFLHEPHAAAAGYRAVVITSDDTDVFVLLLTFKGFFSCPVFVKRSPQTRTVCTNVSRIVRMLGSKSVDLSLPGLHAFTGCHSVGAFLGKGKVTTSKLVKQNKSFQTLFQSRNRNGVEPYRGEICKARRVHLRQDVLLCDKDLSCQRAALLV